MSQMDLNLLPSLAKFQAKRMGLKKKINQGMLVAGGVWLVAVLGVFGWWFLSAQLIKKTEEKTGVIKKELANLAEEIVLGQDLKSKSKFVGEVLATRFEYGQAFRAIQGLFPEGITMNRFELEAKKSIDVEGSISNKAMVDVLESMVEEINRGENEDFSKMHLDSISYTLGEWKFRVKLEMRQ